MRLGVLIRNEAIKVAHDRTFWVALVGLAGLMAIIVGGLAYVVAKTPNASPVALPGAWPQILQSAGSLLVLFVSVTVILLVTGEFRWGTARQTVVAGLSRDELWVGKSLVLVAVVLLFSVVAMAAGGAFALGGTAAVHASLVRPADARLMAGTILDVAGYASLALLLGWVFRRSGLAIGVFFLYVLLEQILGAGLAQVNSAVHVLPRYLPAAVFSGLHRPARYYAAGARIGAARGLNPAASVATGTLVGLAFAYLGIFLFVSWMVVRARDL